MNVKAYENLTVDLGCPDSFFDTAFFEEDSEPLLEDAWLGQFSEDEDLDLDSESEEITQDLTVRNNREKDLREDVLQKLLKLENSVDNDESPDVLMFDESPDDLKTLQKEVLKLEEFLHSTTPLELSRSNAFREVVLDSRSNSSSVCSP